MRRLIQECNSVIFPPTVHGTSRNTIDGVGDRTLRDNSERSDESLYETELEQIFPRSPAEVMLRMSTVSKTIKVLLKPYIKKIVMVTIPVLFTNLINMLFKHQNFGLAAIYVGLYFGLGVFDAILVSLVVPVIVGVKPIVSGMLNAYVKKNLPANLLSERFKEALDSFDKNFGISKTFKMVTDVIISVLKKGGAFDL